MYFRATVLNNSNLLYYYYKCVVVANNGLLYLFSSLQTHRVSQPSLRLLTPQRLLLHLAG